MTHRVAVVGVDGSGKSTVVRGIAERLGFPTGSVATVSCPNYHDARDAPLADLSRELKRLSDGADELGSFGLKMVALYLRMTLFGPVERFSLETFRPAVLVSDRHPVLDTLVYTPLYRRRVAPEGSTVAPELIERWRALAPDAFRAAAAWNDRLNARLGRDVDLAATGTDLLELFERDHATVLDDLGRRYGTTLPDTVVLLDVPAPAADARLAGRASTRELHEDARALEVLSAGYEAALDGLERTHPTIRIVRVPSGGRPVDEVLDEIRAEVGAA